MIKRYEDNSRPVVDCSGDVPLTQQSAVGECDMNEIMRRAGLGAVNQHLNPAAPVFGSLIGLGDLRDAMNLVVEADRLFLELDPFVRKRFHNSPAELLDFVSDDKNREEATKLGLLRAVPVPPVDPQLEELKGLRADMKASGAKKGKSRDDTE